MKSPNYGARIKVSGTNKMLETYISFDGLRALIVVILAVTQIFIGTPIDKKRDVHRDAVHKKELDTPLIPYGPFFSIWLVIFASCMTYAVWQIMPQNLTDLYLQKVSWLTAAIFIGTSAWQVWVPKYSFGHVSLAIILITFLHSILALRVIVTTPAPQNGIAFWFGVAPLLVTIGWISLVTFANLSATLVATKSRYNPRTVTGASLLIILAGVVVSALGFYSRSYILIGSAIWGLIGIIIGGILKKQSHKINGAAGVSIMLILAATGISTI